jgi:hypothetical protein
MLPLQVALLKAGMTVRLIEKERRGVPFVLTTRRPNDSAQAQIGMGARLMTAPPAT